MFIKVTTSGGRRYAQLLESFRIEDGKPRQRTLATLGRLEPELFAALGLPLPMPQELADTPVAQL